MSCKKCKILETISEIYYKNNGVVGYRSMKAYLELKGIVLSHITVHKYMNRELGLPSTVRRISAEILFCIVIREANIHLNLLLNFVRRTALHKS